LKEYCYSEPDVLGASSIVALSPKTEDWSIFAPSGLADDKRDYAFRHLSIKLDKLLNIVTELNK
jgi:cephalosporin-C deacetylase-like acetyl esterase